MLTDDEIDKLEGNDLDAAVAERVMGQPDFAHLPLAWEESSTSDGEDGWAGFACPRCGDTESMLSKKCALNYSTSWAAAGQVVDYLMLDGWRFECGIEDEPFYAIFTKANKRAIAYAYRGAASEHIAVAICHAALRAIAAQGK